MTRGRYRPDGRGLAAARRPRGRRRRLARGKLGAAIGLPAAGAAAAADAFHTALASVRDLATATGLWTRRDLPLEPAGAGRLPDGTPGVLTGDADTDRGALDDRADDAPVAWSATCRSRSTRTRRWSWPPPSPCG
ncbi:hypothetical protein [Streptomyces virginiae]|uniref:Uncharacterized protein n=1 Tax=Streptomyces virginiae TaxID=1961 RepID=A0ABZ1TRJ2_STRVG|nr:hypothetical protein [Streptomyces virginiae]